MTAGLGTPAFHVPFAKICDPKVMAGGEFSSWKNLQQKYPFSKMGSNDGDDEVS